jgi:uncharacterized protein
MITDLVQIGRLGEKRRAENMRFRVWIKNHSFPERRFRHMAEQIEEQIDCRGCANCCRVATTTVSERDAEKLSKFLRIPQARFLEEYTEISPEEGRILRRNEQGCVFLDGNLCSVYEARPHTCIDYPHLVRGKGSIASRMWQFVDRACYCPIVYNALEAYKDDVNFRR